MGFKFYEAGNKGGLVKWTVMNTAANLCPMDCVRYVIFFLILVLVCQHSIYLINRVDDLS